MLHNQTCRENLCAAKIKSLVYLLDIKHERDNKKILKVMINHNFLAANHDHNHRKNYEWNFNPDPDHKKLVLDCDPDRKL